MDDEIATHLGRLLDNNNYVKKGLETEANRRTKLNVLLTQQKLPERHWSDKDIMWLIEYLSSMDYNNMYSKLQIGLGEREGRIYSSLVNQRHYGFAHGIGRSGNITEVQPKAAGSSIIYKLTNKLITDSLRVAGLSKNAAKASLLFPMATGMTISLCLRALAQQSPNAKYVIWPRIDQKSCFKAILTAGLTPVIIENVIIGDEITTNISEIVNKIHELRPENVLCIYTTTSCFAPRVPDKLVAVAALCKEYKIAHLINNAYGVQSKRCLGLISDACAKGRVDYFIQSTDKNYLVPVGGAIVASPNILSITAIGKLYPGRASFSPILDMFITLLSMGKVGFIKLLEERINHFNQIKLQITQISKIYPISLLNTKNNDISLAISLKNVVDKHVLKNLSQNPGSEKIYKTPDWIGPMLFHRNISGARSVFPGKTLEIDGYSFKNWCQHINNFYPNKENDLNNTVSTIIDINTLESVPYVNIAVALGFNNEDIEVFTSRFSKVLESVVGN
ncbi:hypothetical protein BB561_000106 [Smittium simulii]|uniref:O-phosphoseryl-tRNA(Sec) selenium transferase n=1 Tax=Smittium simulii TaxID=133385 RepID=A0A2T9Z0J4_9FUNG|nr:hypothetical protein BB561_000106 [Smittium simulii]